MTFSPGAENSIPFPVLEMEASLSLSVVAETAMTLLYAAG